MNITPIEIQTAGICLDIVAFEDFHQLTENEVREYFPLIQDKIWEFQFSINSHLSEGHVNYLAQQAINVLLMCKEGTSLNDASWVMKQLAPKPTKFMYLH